MWNDDCQGITDLVEPDRVCHVDNRDESQRERVFRHDDLGIHYYDYGCSPLNRGGYECTASLADPTLAKFYWDTPNRELAPAFNQPESCNDQLTGVFWARLRFYNSGSGRFFVFNTHLASPAALDGNIDCRVRQLEATLGPGIDRAIIAGDLNIDVRNSGSPDEKALRNYLSLDGDSGYEYRLYSDPATPTHYTLGVNHTYDLVFEADENAADNLQLIPVGACPVNGELDGFDHRAVRCQVHLVFQ